MAHVHNEECEELHKALEALQSQQQLPRGAVSAFAEAQMVLPNRATDPEGITPEVETEIVKIRRALDALGCDR